MRAIAFRVFFIVFLSPLILPAQHVRDDWAYLEHRFDLETQLDHSLADAPLTAAERAQIYKLIDDKTIHDSFGDSEREEERKAVLGARVGSISLAEDGSRQIVVRGPKQFCGATMNCSIWIYVRHKGQLRLALSTGGNILMIKSNTANGFHDVSTYWHMAADEGAFSVYRWDGSEYKQADCYSARFDLDHRDQPPSTADCPAKPH
jgi:hypothetical protein